MVLEIINSENSMNTTESTNTNIFTINLVNKYMRVSSTFKRHMTLYGTMVCFINLILKSMVLSYTPDSEHILEIAMCSKN